MLFLIQTKTKIYYTVCEFKSDPELRCDLYSSKVNADGTYSEEQLVGGPINIPGYTTTQPSFAKDLLQVMKFFILFQTGLVERVNWMSGWQSTKKTRFFKSSSISMRSTQPKMIKLPIFTKIAELCILVQREKPTLVIWHFGSQWVDGKFIEATILLCPTTAHTRHLLQAGWCRWDSFIFFQ